MTYAVHNLHTAPVEVIEVGASRFYRVSSTGAELPLQFASVPGKQVDVKNIDEVNHD